MWKNLNRKKRFLFSIIAGGLMIISFPFTGSLPVLSFVSWVPLLLIENDVFEKQKKASTVFIHSLFVFFLYNIGTTWWIWNSSPLGSILAIGANTMLMAIAFLLFHFVKKYIGTKQGFVSLPFLWIAFEHLHHQWQISWPWLTYGNVFSVWPSWVQWYEYTGILGGSLWILTLNILIFKFLVSSQKIINQKRRIITFSGVLFLPLLFSLFTYYNYEEKKAPVELVVIQPNIDPYNEKFNGSTLQQVHKIISKSDSLVSSNTAFVIAPETAISLSMDEDQINRYRHLSDIRNWLKYNSNIHFLVGAFTRKTFNEKNSRASQKLPASNQYVEYYNSSIGIEDNQEYQVIHKSKLVPGVEQVPFGDWLKFLDEFSNENGGTSGSLGIEKEAKVMSSKHGVFAPSICYESIYGGYVSDQCRKGAEMIFVITNDGWWGNTPGHKQHLSFSSLRAIENRRSVARSANTGVSAIINQRGDIVKQTTWWKEDAIKASINKNNEVTFYTKYGDFIGRSFSFVACLLLLYLVVSYLKKKFNLDKLKKP